MNISSKKHYLHVRMVGIMAVNMRKSTVKKMHPELFNTLEASLPMPK